MIRRPNNSNSKNKARIARIRDKALKMRERVMKSTKSFFERHIARVSWWQRAFRTPMAGGRWVFSQASALWAAFLSLLGLQVAALDRWFGSRKRGRSVHHARQVLRASLATESLERRALFAGLTFVGSPIVTSEPSGSTVFTVTLDTPPTASVIINLESDDLSEGSVSTGILNFSPTNWSTAQSVTVTGVNDAVDDGDVSYQIDFTLFSLDTSFNGVAQSLNATNNDDDTAGLTVAPVSLSTSEAGSAANFNVALTSEPTANVTLSLSGNTNEGSLSASTLTFTPANWSAIQVVTVTGKDDAIDDGNITYSVTIEAASPDVLYDPLTNAVTVVNADNDTAGISVSAASGNTTEGGSTATFTVKLTSEPTAGVTVSLSGDATEGTLSGSMVFTAANWSTAQTATVTGVNDAIDDGDITYSVALTAGSSDIVYNSKTAAVSVVNQDDADTANLSITAVSGSTSETGSIATFTVKLTSEPTSDVTISAASNDSSEGVATPASLVFTTGNWSIAKTVTVTGQDDAFVDGAIAYSIALNATSLDLTYAGKSGSVVTSNLDNDTAAISVSAISLSTSESGSTAAFNVRLLSQPASSVTIGLVGRRIGRDFLRGYAYVQQRELEYCAVGNRPWY